MRAMDRVRSSDPISKSILGLDLRVEGLRKQYGQTLALNGLTFGIGAGEVHAVLGENGAGKSTLVKVLSGLVGPDAGDVLVGGSKVAIGSPRAAHALGIRTAFQEISLVRDLSVTQNFLLMEEPLTVFGSIQRRRAEEMVREKLAELGMDDIDPRTPVSKIDLPSRQRIEIARAASREPRMLILDEPTASMSARDVEWLGDLIKRLRSTGTTIILISHRMQDVRDFCSRLTVLRNGSAVGTHAVGALTDEEVIELMIGRSIDAVFPHRRPSAAPGPGEVPALSVTEFAAGDAGPFDFEVPRGKIVGIAALQGMGQRDLFLGLFGAMRARSGSLSADGLKCELSTPADATDPAVSIGLIPEDRKTEGLFLDLDGTQNASLPSLSMFERLGLIDWGREHDAVHGMFQRVNLAPRAMWQPVRHLSGGNQQKVILAKWLLAGSRVLMFYDPTRGVDVGTKAEIYRLMRDYADDGGAILFHSTDITELVNLCDSVLVLYRGRIVRRLTDGDLTDTNIMRAAVGHSASEPGAAMSSQPTVVAGAPALMARLRLSAPREPLVAAAVFAAAVALLLLVSPAAFTYADVSNISASATTLALAAMGLTIVVLTGGLDLSIVAVISLVNVLLVTQLGGSGLSVVPYTLAAAVIAIGIGALVGATNGYLVGYLGLQSIVVTLAAMFICQGLARLMLPYPGGEVSPEFTNVFVGDLVPGLIPAPIMVLGVALLVWLYIRSTRFGVALYATGSDPAAASANRVDVRFTRLLAFTAAGAFAGAAGLFLTANTGSGDPLIGQSMLLKTFAAVVLGGTAIGGGRGGAIGTIFGALTLTVIVNVFLVMGIRTYYVPIVEGCVLILAVLGFMGLKGLPAVGWLRRIVSNSARPGTKRELATSPVVRPRPAAPAVDPPPWYVRNREQLRLIAPAYGLLLAAMIGSAIVNGRGFQLGSYVVNLLVFSAFLAILSLGQGAVIIAGGLDLSIGWAITFPAIVVTTLANASDTAALWVIPLALLIGILIGLLNGFLVVGMRLSPIIATLAVGSLLEGAALVFSGGAPIGAVPPMLASFVNGRLLGLPPIVWFLLAFVLGATVLLDLSSFGRRLKAIGNSEWVARLSGVRTERILMFAYILSGFCAAVVGLLLAGFAANAYYDMGKPYLLASIAAVVLGGTSIAGGRGYYPGILGGALVFTALGSLLASTSLPEAMRSVVYGVILLGAVVLLKDRQSN